MRLCDENLLVQRIAPHLSKLKMDNGQLKIIYNNFPFSIFHFPLKESRVQIFALLTLPSSIWKNFYAKINSKRSKKWLNQLF